MAGSAQQRARIVLAAGLILASPFTCAGDTAPPMPDEGPEFLPAFAEMAACGDVSPELVPLYEHWLRQVEPREKARQSLKAELDGDERFVTMKHALSAHWASMPKEALVEHCREQLTFYQRHR